MTNGNDLFLAANRGDTSLKAKAKTAAVLIQEDRLALLEMQVLAEATADPLPLSLSKKLVVKFRMNRRFAMLSSVSAFVVLSAAAAVFMLPAISVPKIGKDQKLPVIETPSLPDKVALAIKQPEPLEANKTEVEITLPAPERIEERPPVAIANSASPVDVDKSSDISVTPEPPETTVADQALTIPVRAVPVTIITGKPKVAVVDTPWEGHDDALGAAASPPSISASSLIDEVGFGVKQATPDAPAAAAPEPIASSFDSEAEISAPANVVPLPKPSVAENDPKVTYRVVDRDGEKSGFWRMRGKDESTKEWFVVVEAIDSKGTAIEMPVMSADTKEIKQVSKWAIRVTEKEFMRLSDEKKTNGVIADATIGEASSRTTPPTWNVDTAGTWAKDRSQAMMITEW